jgi:hypothetical protein
MAIWADELAVGKIVDLGDVAKVVCEEAVLIVEVLMKVLLPQRIRLICYAGYGVCAEG